MKTYISPRTKTSGGALFYTVVLLALVAVYLVSYMLLTENEYVSVGRSQVWNAAMVNAESGVDEALAMVNLDTTGWPSLTAANGWTVCTTPNVYPWAVSTNNTVYQMTRTNFNSGYQIGSGGYTVYINYSATSSQGPEIYSVGYADWSGSTTHASNAVRKVYAQTSAAEDLGNNGLVAYQLTFKGNNVNIDSFNSSSSLHSIWQPNLWLFGTNYGTWSSSLSWNTNTFPCRTANVHVAAETNYIDVGNANVCGYINTTPGGSKSVGSQGSVGDLNWVHGGSTGLQPGHFRDDMNQTFHSLPLPTGFANSVQNGNWLPVRSYTTVPFQTNSSFWITSGAKTTNFVRIGGVYNSNGVLVGAGTIYQNVNNSGWTLPLHDGTTATATYYYVIPNRPEATNSIYYAMNTIDGSGNKIFVDSPYAVVYVTNGMSSPIVTVNTNASLTIWCGGDITFGTTLYNATACARALTINDIAGKPISITGNGNASFIAKLFVPSASVKLGGGGSDTIDIIGEISCNNAWFNGHFNLHYDESLGAISEAKQIVATGWKEVY
ncbi:MAG TPA: hypothetical protein VFV23_10285 [Verrucomicrobiae bacterium]|nr:hypothetical protein [Verrucomicrobiae bacterium]